MEDSVILDVEEGVIQQDLLARGYVLSVESEDSSTQLTLTDEEFLHFCQNVRELYRVVKRRNKNRGFK